MLCIQNNFNMLRGLKTDTFERVVTYPASYAWVSNSVGLLGSSRDTALHLSDEELRYEPRETTVQQNSSNPHEEVKIARLHQQTRFYISFAFVNTIG